MPEPPICASAGCTDFAFENGLCLYHDGYRHKAELGDLGLRAFRRANVQRCEDGFFALESWSPTDWGCALAGEVGELCNLIKKMRRGQEVALSDVADEMVDVFTYLDLLAARLGISLADHVPKKFNEVSRRVNSKCFLPEVVEGDVGNE